MDFTLVSRVAQIALMRWKRCRLVIVCPETLRSCGCYEFVTDGRSRVQSEIFTPRFTHASVRTLDNGQPWNPTGLQG